MYNGVSKSSARHGLFFCPIFTNNKFIIKKKVVKIISVTGEIKKRE